MTYSEILNRVSQDTGMTPEIIDRTYRCYWLYIRCSVEALPLKKDLTETEFLSLKPNFNIPSLGKLTCTFERYKGVKEKFQHIRNIREKNEKAEEH